jgi:hypothetical protein
MPEFLYFSLKLKQQIEQLSLLKKLGKIFIRIQINKAVNFIDRCPLYVVHVMSKIAADKIQEARLKGQI